MIDEIEKLKKENEQLKNRCHAMTHGVICLFCPMECKFRGESFRDDVKAGVIDD